MLTLRTLYATCYGSINMMRRSIPPLPSEPDSSVRANFGRWYSRNRMNKSAALPWSFSATASNQACSRSTLPSANLASAPGRPLRDFVGDAGAAALPACGGRVPLGAGISINHLFCCSDRRMHRIPARYRRLRANHRAMCKIASSRLSRVSGDRECRRGWAGIHRMPTTPWLFARFALFDHQLVRIGKLDQCLTAARPRR